MQNYKFFIHLGTLDVKEILEFQNYLHYKHSNEAVALLVFDYYKRFFPDRSNHKWMEISYAYRKIFGVEMPSTLAGRKKMLNAFSDLQRWLKDFLISEKALKDSTIDHLLWFNILQEKGLSAEYAKHTVRAYKLEQKKVLDSTEACQRQIAIGLHYKQQLVADNPSPDLTAITACAAEIKVSAELISLKMQCELLTIHQVRPPKQKK